jgi:hypothetical protein
MGQAGDRLQRVHGGGFTEPAPEDITRLTVPEIENQLHKINAEQSPSRISGTNA